jgi:hypothetical protein
MTGPICIRVSEEERQSFKEAAARANKTLTSFIKDAALMAARKAESMTEPAESYIHNGLPTYVRATIHNASLGGATSYRDVGWQLAKHLADEIPYSADYDEWQVELDQLSGLLYPPLKRDGRKILSWFDSHYPRIMQKIPRRRRLQFLEGIYQATESEEIALEV